MPRFQGTPWKRMFQNRIKRKFIPIKLDDFGSATWLLIDGRSTVGEISRHLREQFPERLKPGDDTEGRVSRFIFLLYDQRYISFREFEETDQRHPD